jgi:hypothetical protein
MICPECGGEFKNLGVHKRFCKPTVIEEVSRIKNIKVDDYIEEKPLSSVIAEIRGILKSFQHEITVKTVFSGGVTESVEIRARFQPRR